MPRLLFPVLALALLGAACSPARRFVKEGEGAALSGDWERAFRAYDHAVRLDPDHGSAVEGRSRAQEILLERAGTEIERALQAGELDRVHGLMSTARSWEAPAEWLAPRDAAWRSAWSLRLEGAYTQAAGQGHLGEAFVLADALAGFTADPADEARAGEAWTRLRQAEWPAVALEVRGPSAALVRAEVEERWLASPWREVALVPSRGAGTGSLGLDVVVQEDGCQTRQIGTASAVHRYTDGTMEPNPRLPVLERQIRTAQGQLDRALDAQVGRQRDEDEAFAVLDGAERALAAFMPTLERAEIELSTLTVRRDRAQDRVREAEQAQDTLAANAQRRSDLERRLDTLTRRMREVDQRYGIHRHALDEARQAEARSQAEARDAERAVAELTEAEAEAAEQLRVARETLERIRERLASLDAEPPGPDAELPSPPELRERLEEVTGRLEAQRARLARREAALETARAEDPDAVPAAEAAVAEAQERVTTLEARAARVQVRLLQSRFLRQRGERRRARQTLDGLRDERLRAEGALGQATTTAEAAAARAGEAQALVDEDEARMAELQRRHQRIGAEVSELAMEAQQIAPIAADLPRRVDAFRQHASGWRAALAARDRAGDRVAALTVARDRSLAEHRERRAARIEAGAVVDGWRDRVDTLKAERAREPDRTEVVKSVRYTIEQHERRCVVRATSTLTSPGLAPVSGVDEQVDTDRDDRIRAQPRVGLEGDPLAFEEDDATTLATLRRTVVSGLEEQLAARVRQEGTRRLQAGTQDRDARSRDLALAAFMGADEGAALSAYVGESYALPPAGDGR